MTIAATDREFRVFNRGEIREELLGSFRIGLRQFTNNDTGAPFTEVEIATATAVGSRFWIESDAVDLVLIAEQQRALWLADQIDIDRASTSWLIGYHGDLWGESPLPAAPGSGPVDAPALVGTVWAGSTTIGDPAAVYGTDPAGLSYQVVDTVTTPGTGIAKLTLVGRDTGEATNIDVDTTITWANAPLNAEPEATVTERFRGGVEAESNAQFARRLKARVRHKPGAGNASHFRVWAREATGSVEDAFVYCCAFHAGSVFVVVTQKRANVLGPNARIPTAQVLERVRNYIVPRKSLVVPARAHVVVGPPVIFATDLVLTLALGRGARSGWTDVIPFPSIHLVPAAVSLVTTNSDFRFVSDNDNALPTGVTKPAMMMWNRATWRFEKLDIATVTKTAAFTWRLQLNTPPSFDVMVGDLVSPDTERRSLIDLAIENYFDELGPGEVIDLQNDDRAHRAFRFPVPEEERQYRAGSAITVWVTEALGVNTADVLLHSITQSVPTPPYYVIQGPNLLAADRVAVYAPAL